MAQLRLVKPAAVPRVVTHVNRMGDTYFLHEGKTKTGKPRYFFAKSVRDGALAEMPPGLEVSESINGVVSVRRITAGAVAVPESDVKLVEAAVARHEHLAGYLVRVVGSAMVDFEPHPRPAELRDIAERLGRVHRAASFIEERMKKAQYAPVLKFEREGDVYVVHRMTYRGEGGWSWPLMDGKLAALAKKVVSSIGTDAFYELV
ncbi:MAG TPA: hypothetical protein VF316_00135 [Polyangiaceae bacterium]